MSSHSPMPLRGMLYSRARQMTPFIIIPSVVVSIAYFHQTQEEHRVVAKNIMERDLYERFAQLKNANVFKCINREGKIFRPWD